MVAAVDLSGITSNYPGCWGRLNVDPVRIRYRVGSTTSPNIPLPPLSRSLCTDPTFFIALNGPHGFLGRLVSFQIWLGRESGRRD